MARIPPPWVKTKASSNVAKRARALGIMRRKGIKPLSKAAARRLCAAAINGRQQ